jgi:hypothetical protein
MPDLAGSICDCGNPKVFQMACGGRKKLCHMLVLAPGWLMFIGCNIYVPEDYRLYVPEDIDLLYMCVIL